MSGGPGEIFPLITESTIWGENVETLGNSLMKTDYSIWIMTLSGNFYTILGLYLRYS